MAGAGDPYCSLVNVAAAADGTPLLLISRLAIHTKNVLADPRVSLMLDERKPGDPLEGARVMLMGTTAVTEDPAARRRYLAQQPEAEMFAGFADFAFYAVKLKGAHLVAGFGRIVDLSPSDLLTDLTGAEALLAAEPEAIEHMNADHADACRLFATRLLGAPDGRRAQFAEPARPAGTARPRSHHTGRSPKTSSRTRRARALRAGPLWRRRSGLPHQDARLHRIRLALAVHPQPADPPGA
jgi:putative heme iron utilization protein